MTWSDVKKQIESKLSADISKVLGDEVFEAVRVYEREAIQKDVYDAYEPKDYMRRGDKGGLIDEHNIKGTVVGNVLTVRNVTPPNKPLNGIPSCTTFSTTPVTSVIDQIVEYNIGNSHGYGWDWWHLSGKDFPRPFTEGTRDRLEKHELLYPNHVDALVTGLSRLGYKVSVIT